MTTVVSGRRMGRVVDWSVHSTVLCVGLLGLTGCGEAPGESDFGEPLGASREAAVVSVTMRLPSGLHPSEVVIAANDFISIHDRARTFSNPFTGEYATVTNMGSNTTTIGVDAHVGTIFSRGAPWLRDRATVHGGLYSTTAPMFQNGTVVTGPQQSGVAFVDDVSWTRTYNFPDTLGPAPVLEPGGTPNPYLLAPGNYHHIDLKSGRTLRLTAGDYYLQYFTSQPNSTLFIDGSQGNVRLFLSGSITKRGLMTGINTPGMPIPGFTVVSSGNGVNIVEQRFRGVLIAPNGLIRIEYAQQPHEGAFFGRSVELYQGNQVNHVRDFRSFIDFDTFRERTQVTGGSVRLGANLTDGFEQAEAAAIVSRSPSGFNVTVAYNDHTQDPASPRFEFPEGLSGASRIVHKGISLMGWSYSTDGGHTFRYGGRVPPPTGWSTIWGDSTLAKVDIDDPYVFFAQVAGSTAAFEATPEYDPVTQTVIDARPGLDGLCVARSTDRGVSFPTVACVDAGGFHDGSAVAVARDGTNRRQVYLASHDIPGGASASVWRMDGETMAFTRLENPFAGATSLHPRLRQVGGTLYVVTHSPGGRILANRLDATTNATTWMGQVEIVASGALELPALPGGTALRRANGFSFDVGTTNSGSRFRLIHDATVSATPGFRTRECMPDLTGCMDGPWVNAGFGVSPSLRVSGSRWAASLWQGGGNDVQNVAVELRADGTVGFKDLSPAVVPCMHDPNDVRFWGDYNEIDAFADGRFFMPYTINGPGCRFQGDFIADMHVGATIVEFPP